MSGEHAGADEGHDPKQLLARLKSPTSRPAQGAWKGKAEIEVCDPLLAKRLDEQRKKASPGQVRRVYSKPPAEAASHAAAAAPVAAPPDCECDAAGSLQASEGRPAPAEEPPEPAEQQRPASGAAVGKPDDVSRSALTLPMAACAIAVVAAAALLHARLRRV